MDMIDTFLDYPPYILAIAITMTIAVVLASTKYLLLKGEIRARSMRNSCCSSHREETSEQSNECEEDSQQCDPTGNDGDDELDGEEDNVETEIKDQVSSANHSISPRYPDPVEYCEHIQGEIKRVKQQVATKSIEKTLTDDQLQEEREVQRKQLSEIFRLMQEQEERFGIKSFDDMQEQMKLYCV